MSTYLSNGSTASVHEFVFVCVGFTGLVCVREVFADWYGSVLHHCKALKVKRGQRPALAMMGKHREEEDSDLVNITSYVTALCLFLNSHSSQML